MRNKLKFFLAAGIVVIGILILSSLLFGAPNKKEQKREVFIVGMKTANVEVFNKLKEQGFIKNIFGFNLALTIKNIHKEIQPGGYYLSKNMDAWKIIEKIFGLPDMKWVVIPEGLRKEQIGERLAKTFNWSNDELEKWNTTYTAMKFDYFEGVYFPDTYLIPVNEDGLAIANRMINRFNEKFSPYINEFAKQNIVWTTGLKIASIIQREAAGKEDMPLIAGIIWNRLLTGMKLDIDATIQYAKGKTDGVWWSVVTPEDITNIDSPYNTYKYKGLPPHPISNPGIEAIKAVLYPVETDCLYYLHDKNQQIHCAKTYEEHIVNIKKYL